MLPVATENTRVNGKVAIWLFQAQFGKLATSRLCERIIDWVRTLAEPQWLAPRERMALFNNSDSPRQLGEEGNP
jgi:hypothetical protein